MKAKRFFAADPWWRRLRRRQGRFQRRLRRSLVLWMRGSGAQQAAQRSSCSRRGTPVYTQLYTAMKVLKYEIASKVISIQKSIAQLAMSPRDMAMSHGDM